MSNLKQQWIALAMKYSTDTDKIEAIWNEIKFSYSSETRFYHNLYHIKLMLELLQFHNEKLINTDAVLFAVWFHDIIYDPLQFNNEEKSSEYATEKMKQLNIPEDIILKSSLLILKTKNHMIIDAQEDIDIQLFLDTDLVVLGAKPEKYKQYTEQIRMEYQTYNNLIYYKGRKKVLEKFLDTTFIYRTVEYRNQYEKQARNNIINEIQTL